MMADNKPSPEERPDKSVTLYVETDIYNMYQSGYLLCFLNNSGCFRFFSRVALLKTQTKGGATTFKKYLQPSII